jgi:tripartite-type tricarboxylate transporter receptor subunit TctC
LRMHAALGMTWSFIPYRGGAPAMQDMMAGQFDIMCTATGSFFPLVRANQIRAYAVTAKKRMEAAPEIPTTDDAGLPGFYVGVWNAMWAPKDTPKAVIAKLNDAAVKALNDPGLRSRIVNMGLDMPPKDQLTPEARATYQRAEAGVWWPIMQKMKDSAPK